jgi:hypothetical protein
LTGLISEYRPELAQGFFHTVEGWILFIVALVLLVAFHQVVNRIYQTVKGSTPEAPGSHVPA